MVAALFLSTRSLIRASTRKGTRRMLSWTPTDVIHIWLTTLVVAAATVLGLRGLLDPQAVVGVYTGTLGYVFGRSAGIASERVLQNGIVRTQKESNDT